MAWEELSKLMACSGICDGESSEPGVYGCSDRSQLSRLLGGLGCRCGFWRVMRAGLSLAQKDGQRFSDLELVTDDFGDGQKRGSH